MYLSYLDLLDNLLSGELLNCWGNMMLLAMLNLTNNNFSRRIPNSICSYGVWLQTLHLQNNSFIKELPKSLIRCKLLVLLDLGENTLREDTNPTTIGCSSPAIKLVHGSHTITIMSANIYSNLGPLSQQYYRDYTIMPQ
jgi:hypothetical protein